MAVHLSGLLTQRLCGEHLVPAADLPQCPVVSVVVTLKTVHVAVGQVQRCGAAVAFRSVSNRSHRSYHWTHWGHIPPPPQGREVTAWTMSG